MYADILVLAYNRPVHLKRLLESIAENEGAGSSSISVSIDGPKNHADIEKIMQCNEVASINYGFKRLEVFNHTTNRGLADSVIDAVSTSFLKCERLIVLEDDLVVSRSFLNFMNSSLEKYQSHDQVASIQGYQYPGIKLSNGPVFLRGADCWGWATWRDRWRDTDFDSDLLISGFDSPQLKSQFDFEGNKPNFDMLLNQSKGRVNSWAIRWHASQFLKNRLSLFPEVSLVQNLGADGSGTNSGENSIFLTEVSDEYDFKLPDLIEESTSYRKQLDLLFSSIYGGKERFTWKRTILKLVNFRRNEVC
jgi:hypothetical protein